LENSFKSSRLYGFFCELRRRKVYRVAAGYSVVGWLVIQFAVAVLPVLTLPLWTTRLVIVLVLAGFPIALILAWAFDIGAEGIQVTPEPAPGVECPPALPGRRKNIFALALVGLLISGLIGYFVLSRSVSEAGKVDRRSALREF
jgi:adenylate cyclase